MNKIEIPKDLQLPTHQEVILHNLNITDLMLGSLLPLLDKFSSEAKKVRFGFKEKKSKYNTKTKVIEEWQEDFVINTN